ncbi:MAG: 23S rRNA (uracil(1939)-C(5))-methyltransferase RlmD [Candidatus Latescibacteria bacterium]|nr:23S rRNA (uracil(1939)-C(5))-methyltransferase RlmD [Candidatus Latescibacterota bacterium]
MTDLQPGQFLTVEIEKLVYGGDGLARHESCAVFVPRGVPGDRVVVRLTEVKATYARGEITEILSPSPSRLHPECQAFHDGCGGCQWLHIAYADQLAWKKRIVEETLARVGKLPDVPVHDVIGMTDPFFYRNKLVVRARGPAEKLRVGLHTPKTHWVVNVFNRADGQCYIQSPLNNRLARALAAFLVRRRLPLKVATIQTSEEGEVGIDLDRKLTAEITAELHGIGRQSPHVHYTVNGRRFRVTPPSFFQANTAQTGALIDAALGLLPEGRFRTVVDVYCGVGLFSLFLAGRADVVYGIEESRTAVEDARHNAEAQGASNVRFIRGKAEEGLPAIVADAGRVDAVLVDPPRAGCDPVVLDAISRCQPSVLVYVSCDPTTLARDLAVLRQQGLIPTEVQPVDMFPQTYHIECVAACVRV